MNSEPVILLVNGPNLNLLGEREPERYGATTLAELEAALSARARDLGVQLVTFQSNSEADIINHLHARRSDAHGIIINPAGLTHYSVALRDALLCMKAPIIETHISNIHAREPFRRQSLIADIAVGSITGLGLRGYFFALEFLAELISRK